MPSLFLPFAQEIASEERDEYFLLLCSWWSRNHKEKNGAMVSFDVGRKLEEEELSWGLNS